MDTVSGSWYSYYETLYNFDKHMVEFTQDEHPEDYEEEIGVMGNHQCYGRFRYCHVVLDRHDSIDAIDLSVILYEDLFEQSPKFTPWEHEISEDFKVDRCSELFHYMDSMFCDERNKNTNKFLIIVKFGVITRNYEANVADREIDEVEIGFVPASKSSIDGLENVSGLGECAICLEDEEGKNEAKRMPCGHDFHVRCIEQWLETSHLCPLCRYAMPIHERFISNDE